MAPRSTSPIVGSPGGPPPPPGAMVLGNTGVRDPGSPAGPFSAGSCPPGEHCGPGRKPVHLSQAVVRPGKKNGGTTLVFSLTHGALVRFTIVRVHPSCERVGSFTVRADGGVNRVPFRGRYRGRALPAGTYRLLVHAQGQERAAAAVTIVITRGNAKPTVLRRARRANSCSPDEAREIENAANAAAGGLSGNSGNSTFAGWGRPARVIHGAVAGMVKGVASKAQALNTSIDDHFPNPVIQTIVGLLTLMSACLGGLVLTRLRTRLLR